MNLDIALKLIAHLCEMIMMMMINLMIFDDLYCDDSHDDFDGAVELDRRSRGANVESSFESFLLRIFWNFSWNLRKQSFSLQLMLMRMMIIIIISIVLIVMVIMISNHH